MSRKARKNVDRIMGQRGIIYWANWPDEIKSDTIYAQSIKDGWHYQDLAAGLSDDEWRLENGKLIIAPEKTKGNLYKALDSLVTVLKDYKTVTLKDRSAVRPPSAVRQEHVLRFIVHLSGDRYCPMHLAHMDDKGGNAVKMQWFGRNTNLHSVWDTKLIESQGYSYTEYAQMIEDEFGWKRKAIEQATDEELLRQSYHRVEEIYRYQETWDENTYHYIYRWHKDCEEQLYIAGIRLAKLLNEIF